MFLKKIIFSLCILLIVFDGLAQQKHKIKSIHITHSESQESSTKLLDTNGKIISEKIILDIGTSVNTYTASGNINTILDNIDGDTVLWTNVYNKYDKLIRLEHYNYKTHTTFMAVAYTYDSKNRELTKADYNGYGQLNYLRFKSYDDINNTCTAIYNFNAKPQKLIYKFDDKGNEIARETHDGNDTVAYSTYKYDEQNRQVEYKLHKGAEYESATHHYNMKGDEVNVHYEWRRALHAYKLEIDNWDSTYEYDSDGNITKLHTLRTLNGKVKEDSYTYFTYEYY